MTASVLVFAMLLPGSTPPAPADTVYLVSGRLIHTASVRIEGERVYFSQFGGEVSIPLEEVLRIVDDDEVEQPSGPWQRGEAPPRAGAAEAATADPKLSSGGAITGDPPAAAGADAAPPSAGDPEYWIERIREVDLRIASVQSELDRLPYYDETDRRLLRFNGQARYFIAERQRWETMMADLKLSRRQLLYAARKAGILPGSLRQGLRNEEAG